MYGADWKKWYADPTNRARHLANNARRTIRRRKEIRALIIQAKSKPCADCSHSYPHWIMEFDHLPGRGKKFILAKACAIGYSDEKLMAEIAKCEVVCSNCHANRTYQRGIRRGGSDPCKV